jgi:uncharacterized RDD family membrane protein YckC
MEPIMNQTNLDGQYAGFISRFIAFSLDLIIISVVSFLVTTFLGMIINFFGLNSAVGESVVGEILNTLQDIVLLTATLFTAFFSMVYFLFFWVVAGFTPGKGLLGLRVVRTDGRPVTIGPALARFIGYWLSALVLFMGFLWVAIDRRHQGWHDKLGGTVVVYNPSPTHRP